jgi:hypothetical protein
MSVPLVDRINFAKIVTVLAVVFGISFGLCGLAFLVSSGSSSAAGFLMSMGMVELAVMGVSAAGLVLTVIVWVALAVITSFRETARRPQKLFDDADGVEHDDRK